MRHSARLAVRVHDTGTFFYLYLLNKIEELNVMLISKFLLINK